MKLFAHLTLLLSVVNAYANSIEVVDDIGRVVKLPVPASRIISLAPHITENLFAAGAGAVVVGAVSFSDYPEEAKNIARIGSYNNLNIEVILSLKPDLVIAWKEGNQKKQVERLIELGINVYVNDSKSLEDIAKSIRNFGKVSGKNAMAKLASDRFMERLTFLRTVYSGEKKISVFYETWHQPLLTVNKQQFIGRIIELCSGKNIFADLEALAPQVSVEAVLAGNPDVIIASGMGEKRPDWLDNWKKWPFLNAVKSDKLLFVPPDIIQRHSPRLLDGAELICEYLQQMRQNNIPVK